MGFQETFKALSDPARRETINLLKDGKRGTGDIVSHLLGIDTMASHHLSTLRKVGLITDEKQGKYIYYEPNTSVTDEIIGRITSLRGEERRKNKP